MNDYKKTILTQYAASPSINKIIKTFNDTLSPDDFIDDFFYKIWNIDTAETYGLDVWGAIVDVSRTLPVTNNSTFFGFSEALIDGVQTVTDPQPFGQAPFYSGKSNTDTVTLSDPVYRKLILMKAMANITDCTIPNINTLLMQMFGDRGRAYVVNDGGLKMSYVFEFTLTTAELAIIQSSDALPSPPGVAVSIVQKV